MRDSTDEEMDEAFDEGTQESPIYHRPVIAVRGFLPRNEAAPSGLGGYGYLVFTERPSHDDPARHLATCEAFLGTLEPSDALPEDVPLEERMVTFWLLETPLSGSLGEAPSCPELVDRYDYPRAAVIATEVGKLGVEGPLLVAWAEPYEEARGQREALILDLSLFSDQDIQRAIRIWKDQVSRQPEHWEDGFKMVQFRETFRNLLERYGDGILTLLRLGA